MKRFLTSIPLFTLAFQLALAQDGHLYNGGSSIHIGTGGSINVGGQVSVQEGSKIDNNGLIAVKGNWNNDAATKPFVNGSPGVVELNGSASQTITGTSEAAFDHLVLADAGKKELGVNVKIDGTLDLADNELAANDHLLTISSTDPASITRNQGWITTEKNGGLIRHMNTAAQTYLYPLGVSVNNELKYIPYEMTLPGAALRRVKLRLIKENPVFEAYNTASKSGGVSNLNYTYYHIIETLEGTADYEVKATYNEELSDPGLANWYTADYQWKRIPEAGTIQGLGNNFYVTFNAAQLEDPAYAPLAIYGVGALTDIHPCVSNWFNKNNSVHISSGINLVVAGDIYNDVNTAIHNEGTMQVTCNWTNNTGIDIFGGTQGTVEFSGMDQLISGAYATDFYNLTISGTGQKTLETDITVNGNFDLTNRELLIGDQSVELANADPNALGVLGGIIANGTGSFTRSTNSLNAYTYPVKGSGTAPAAYNVDLTPGIIDNQSFTVRVIDEQDLEISFDQGLYPASTTEEVVLDIVGLKYSGNDLKIRFDIDVTESIVSVYKYNGQTATYDPLGTEYYTITQSNTLVLKKLSDFFAAAYAILKRKLDGGYHETIDGKIYFFYEERYNVGAAANLDYAVYNNQRTALSTGVTIPNQYGGNWRSIDLTNTGLAKDGFYTLEVKNDKNEVMKLRFKYDGTPCDPCY